MNDKIKQNWRLTF